MAKAKIAKQIFKTVGKKPKTKPKPSVQRSGEPDQLKEAREYNARPDVIKMRNAEDKMRKIKKDYKKGILPKKEAVEKLKPLMEVVADFEKKNPGPRPVYAIDLLQKRKAGGSIKKKGYKAGTGKSTVAKPRGVGCAMRGYGKAMIK